MVLHALFGNEQDGCSNHQAAADHVEDGGADAAGAGQGSTDIIDDICSQSASFFINIKGDFANLLLAAQRGQNIYHDARK